MGALAAVLPLETVAAAAMVDIDAERTEDVDAKIGPGKNSNVQTNVHLAMLLGKIQLGKIQVESGRWQGVKLGHVMLDDEAEEVA